MIRGCSTILPKNFSLCFVCRWNSFLPAQLSNACQWSVSAHFKILQGRFPAGKVLPSKQFLIMILKLVVDRKCLCVLDISVEFRITPVCEIMCEYWVCYISIGEMGLIILVHQDLHLHLVCTCTLFAPSPSLQKTVQTQRRFIFISLPLFPFNGLMFSTFLLPIGNAVKENFTFLAMSVLSAMHLNFKSVHCSVSTCLTSKSCFLSIR